MATIVKNRQRVVHGVEQAASQRKPYTVRYQDQGRQKERSFATLKEANEFKVKFEHDSREHSFVDPRAGKVIFTDYAAAWIDRLDRAPTTKATYRSVLNAKIAPVLNGRTLAQVAQDREAVQALINGMGGSASRRTAALGVITGAVAEAQRAGKIGPHRLNGLSVRKDAQKAADIIPATTAQLEILAKGLRPDLALTVWLMRGAGLRISEALAVRLDGFRDNGKVLRVCEQATRDGSTGPLKSRKPGEYRDMPIPRWLWAKVQAHVDAYGTHDGYLFGNGRRPLYGTYHERFVKAVAKAGLGSMTEHGLRHLYASTLLGALVPITDLAAWLGHRDINVTYAIYSHLLPDSWTRGREALDDIL